MFDNSRSTAERPRTPPDSDQRPGQDSEIKYSESYDKPDASPLIFISAKSSDYPYAAELYKYLAQRNRRVFFSDESLPTLGSSDYRKQIDQALEDAQHMVVVTSSRNNVDSGWVQFEWGSFLNELRSGRKKGNLVTLIVGNASVSEMPLGLRSNQVIVYDQGAFESISKYLR
jgi:hypothetical protein